MSEAARIPDIQRARMERFFAHWSDRQIRITTVLWGLAGATSCFNAVFHRAHEVRMIWGVASVVWLVPLIIFRLKVDQYRRIRDVVDHGPDVREGDA